jgi:hypothetical protein
VTRTAPYWTQSTNTHTTWTFNSSPPADGVTESVPLLLVDYDLGALDLRNRAQRGDDQEIDLFVHREQGAPAASVRSLTVSASYDDGATWRTVQAENEGHGHYVAEVPNRESAQNVSLRVQASDSGGSGITQTIIRAYGLH